MSYCQISAGPQYTWHLNYSKSKDIEEIKLMCGAWASASTSCSVVLFPLLRKT